MPGEAGAMVDGNIVTRTRRLGIEAPDYIDNNDSYTFFQRYDAASGAHSQLNTGPTGANVMDMQKFVPY